MKDYPRSFLSSTLQSPVRVLVLSSELPLTNVPLVVWGSITGSCPFLSTYNLRTRHTSLLQPSTNCLTVPGMSRGSLRVRIREPYPVYKRKPLSQPLTAVVFCSRPLNRRRDKSVRYDNRRSKTTNNADEPECVVQFARWCFTSAPYGCHATAGRDQFETRIRSKFRSHPLDATDRWAYAEEEHARPRATVRYKYRLEPHRSKPNGVSVNEKSTTNNSCLFIRTE